MDSSGRIPPRLTRQAASRNLLEPGADAKAQKSSATGSSGAQSKLMEKFRGQASTDSSGAPGSLAGRFGDLQGARRPAGEGQHAGGAASLSQGLPDRKAMAGGEGLARDGVSGLGGVAGESPVRAQADALFETLLSTPPGKPLDELPSRTSGRGIPPDLQGIPQMNLRRVLHDLVNSAPPGERQQIKQHYKNQFSLQFEKVADSFAADGALSRADVAEASSAALASTFGPLAQFDDRAAEFFDDHVEGLQADTRHMDRLEKAGLPRGLVGAGTQDPLLRALDSGRGASYSAIPGEGETEGRLQTEFIRHVHVTLAKEGVGAGRPAPSGLETLALFTKALDRMRQGLAPASPAAGR